MKMTCAALMVCVALAQTPTEKKPVVVEGKVVNSITGEAIRKADVTLTTSLMPEGFDAMAKQLGLEAAAMADGPAETGPKKTFTAVTDAGGRFKFDNVTPGDYYLIAKHVSFVDGTYKPADAKSTDGRLHVSAGQDATQVEFRLIPQGAVAGRVLDEDGDPVRDAMVTAVRYNYSSGHRKLQPSDTVTTNDRGEFRLSKLPPGRYYVNAEASALNFMEQAAPPPADGTPETSYVCTYFPGTTDVESAEAIDVKAGGEVSAIAIHLKKSKVVRVKGKLVGADGKPLQQAQLMLMSQSRPGSMRMTMVSNKEGKFELANVSPGTYTAMTMQMGGPNPSMVMQPLIVTNEGVSDLKLGSVIEGSLQGRVTVANDGKVDIKGLVVMLIGEEDGLMPSVGTVTGNGTFALTKVGQTRYELSVPTVPPGAYLKSVQWNSHEMLGQPLDLSAGVAGDLQLTLGTDGGGLTATVSNNDKPAADATVVLLPASDSRRFPETTRNESTDGAGHVEFKDVPPGDYLAFAWERVDDGDWFDPVFVKAAMSQATRVSVEAKGSQRVELKLIHAAK